MKAAGRKSDLGAGDLTNKGILSILATSKGTAAERIAEEGNDTQSTEAGGEAEFDSEDLMLDHD